MEMAEMESGNRREWGRVCVRVWGGVKRPPSEPPTLSTLSSTFYSITARRGHVRGTQLGELPEPLVLASVDDAHAERVQLDVPMHRIVEHLSFVVGLIAVLSRHADRMLCAVKIKVEVYEIGF